MKNRYATAYVWLVAIGMGFFAAGYIGGYACSCERSPLPLVSGCVLVAGCFGILGVLKRLERATGRDII